MDATRDKYGREFKVGDVLKVFHFIGKHGKKRFMYKQIVGFRKLGGLGGSSKKNYFDVCHLNMSDKENYHIGKDQGVLTDYEILQGLDDIDTRPKQLN